MSSTESRPSDNVLIVPPSATEYESATPNGASFTGLIERVTTTTLLWSSPSLATYVNESLVVSEPSWVYLKLPSDPRLKLSA